MKHPTLERFGEIDLLRALAILLMIVYHTVYDLSAFFAFPIDPRSFGWLLLERITAHLFLLIVGVSFAVSWEKLERKGTSYNARLKKYALRALAILVCGMLVSLATAIVDPHTYVRFGILHLIAASVLLLPFFFTLRAWNFLLGMIVIMIAPVVHDVSVSTSLLLPLGIAPSTFASVDYFPLFPWFGTVLIGASLGNLLYGRSLLQIHLPLEKPWQRALTFPGRYSLLIYLVHQPIILALLWMFLK